MFSLINTLTSVPRLKCQAARCRQWPSERFPGQNVVVRRKYDSMSQFHSHLFRKVVSKGIQTCVAAVSVQQYAVPCWWVASTEKSVVFSKASPFRTAASISRVISKSPYKETSYNSQWVSTPPQAMSMPAYRGINVVVG